MKQQQEIEKELKELLPIISKDYFVEKIGYFGSYARNEQTIDSDIDVLVKFSKPLGWAFFDLQILLENKLNLKVDLVTENGLKEQLKVRILNEVRYV